MNKPDLFAILLLENNHLIIGNKIWVYIVFIFSEKLRSKPKTLEAFTADCEWAKKGKFGHRIMKNIKI